MGKHNSDREFDPDRNKWLRKHKRAPLEQRFEEVFGLDGVWRLLPALRSAFSRNGAYIPEAFERRARAILWHCAKISLENSGMERRLKYVETCIQELHPLHYHVEPEGVDINGDDIFPEEKSVPELFEEHGIAFQKVVEMYVSLETIYLRRWPDDDVRAGQAAGRILRAAATKAYPLKYIRAVIRNEAKSARTRRRH